MESKQSDRSTCNILKVILSGLLGAALGLFGSVVGFEHLEQPILELQPTHVSIVVGASLLCGSLAAIDVKKFLGAVIDSLSTCWQLRYICLPIDNCRASLARRAIVGIAELIYESIGRGNS